jgi:hypothetical protein
MHGYRDRVAAWYVHQPERDQEAGLGAEPDRPNPDKFALKVASANCLGLLKAGDTIQLSAAFTVINPATLTVNAR